MPMSGGVEIKSTRTQSEDFAEGAGLPLEQARALIAEEREAKLMQTVRNLGSADVVQNAQAQPPIQTEIDSAQTRPSSTTYTVTSDFFHENGDGAVCGAVVLSHRSDLLSSYSVHMSSLRLQHD